MEGIVIAILWSVCSLLVMIQYAPMCADIPRNDWLLAGIIFIIDNIYIYIIFNASV